jgi:hypothetical protein
MIFTNLSVLGVPPATAKLAAWFARNPTARPTVRELQRTLGIASASAQRDLDRLTGARALRVIVDGRMRRYAPVMDSPIWPAVRILLGVEGAVPPARSQVREAAMRYGVDLSQLESMLRLTVEERLTQLDTNAAFFAEARKGLKR